MENKNANDATVDVTSFDESIIIPIQKGRNEIHIKMTTHITYRNLAFVDSFCLLIN